jgi:dihydrofolate synthase/folylpolyglutamate synthase
MGKTNPATIPPRSPYVEFLKYLEASRSAGVVLGLDRTRTVLEQLGHPERRSVTVQIAGTNGKGSTAALVDAILRAEGIRTGLYTSPHLCRFTERIRVDGVEVDGDRLATLAQAVRATGVPLTYFEIATVLAFLIFAQSAVEVAILETGLGGRLDATTACAPVGTAITSIAFDHVELLGPTLAGIAHEKAGIAKPGVPLFLAPVPVEADTEIARVAKLVGAPLMRFGADFAPSPAAPGLSGLHQRTNAAVAVALARTAAEAAGRPLTARSIEQGLRSVVWPGRLEWLDERTLVDCAHNVEGAAALAAALAGMPKQPRVLVFAAVGGKAAGAMLEALAPHVDAIFVTRSSNERSVAPQVLAGLVPPAVAPRVTALATLGEALAAARHRAGPQGVVVAAGSTFLVGDLRADLLGEPRDPLPTSDPLSPDPLSPDRLSRVPI